MPMFVKMGISSTGFQGHPTNELRRKQKFANRRIVKEGFPWRGKFECREQIEKYLSAERIECLICGKMYKKLGGLHLKNIHDMTDDEYRQQFNIPWTYPLCSTHTSENYSAAVNKRLKDPDTLAELRENVAAGRERMKATPPKQRERRDFTIQEMTERAIFIANGRDSEYTDADFEEIRDRILSGIPAQKACAVGGPRYTAWRKYCRDNPEFEKSLERAIDKLPFATQARMRRLGERFNKELRKLYDNGYSDHKAATILGVTVMTCNKITRMWRNEK